MGLFTSIIRHKSIVYGCCETGACLALDGCHGDGQLQACQEGDQWYEYTLDEEILVDDSPCLQKVTTGGVHVQEAGCAGKS